MSRRRFHWREEQTSQDSRRQSRGTTPNLSVRFQLNRKGSEVNSSPQCNVIHSVELRESQREETSSVLAIHWIKAPMHLSPE
ncbi:hypothetical protein E2C01_076244 [Portunus trituberculatus]|uniref:Uncharacterized protein n=1 Tax=Portunus trituberculatus TaxID=210409 RepID=A0A5B7IJB6_PORTR|nr:hypothetical protein [Portunus trituberculatus]